MSDEDRYIRNYLNQNPHIENYHLEVPYNQYGSRGFVDAVFSWEPSGDGEPTFYEIVEVKSEAAIREATGANEIIRQVQKMAAYFIEGQETEIVDTENHIFRLDIIDTEHNRQHLLENYDLYQSIHDENGDLTPRISVQLVSQKGETQTTFHNLKEWIEEWDGQAVDIRNPDNPSPISLLDWRKEPEGEMFCHRHGQQKCQQKPVFKANGQRYVAEYGYRLFWCSDCLIEILSQQTDDPFSIIHELGGFGQTILYMMTKGVKEEGLSAVIGGEDFWVEIDDIDEAENYRRGDEVDKRYGQPPVFFSPFHSPPEKEADQ